MKKSLIILALTACASTVYADPTAVLQLNGKLTNSSCTPEFSNGGIIDYGYIRLGELSSTETNQLGQKKIDFNINCISPTKIGWTLVDDKADTAATGITIKNAFYNGDSTGTGNTWTFGVGKTKDDVTIGAYSAFIDAANVIADGNKVRAVYNQKGSEKWTQVVGFYLQGNSYRTWSVGNATGTYDPIAVSDVTFPIVTSLAIRDTTTLAITDDTNLDGQLRKVRTSS